MTPSTYRVGGRYLSPIHKGLSETFQDVISVDKHKLNHSQSINWFVHVKESKVTVCKPLCDELRRY